jgi:hypothetical protein
VEWVAVSGDALVLLRVLGRFETFIWSVEQCSKELGWPEPRVRDALAALVGERLVLESAKRCSATSWTHSVRTPKPPLLYAHLHPAAKSQPTSSPTSSLNRSGARSTQCSKSDLTPAVWVSRWSSCTGRKGSAGMTTNR